MKKINRDTNLGSGKFLKDKQNLAGGKYKN